MSIYVLDVIMKVQRNLTNDDMKYIASKGVNGIIEIRLG